MTDNRFREILEAGLAATIAHLERLSGLNCVSRVYRVELADGRRVFAKRSSVDGYRTQAFLKAAGGNPLLPKSLMDPVREGDEWVSAFEWKETHRRNFAQLTDGQFASFRRASQELCRLLQSAPDVEPARDGRALRSEFAAYVARHPLARLVIGCLAALTDADCMFAADAPTAVIHGDFHAGNFGFDGEALAAFYDFDLLRRGNPLEDLAFLATEEVKRGIAAEDFARLVERMRRLIAESGRPRDEWRVAFNQARLWEALKLIRRHPERLRTALNVARRDRRFVRLMEAVGLSDAKTGFLDADALALLKSRLGVPDATLTPLRQVGCSRIWKLTAGSREYFVKWPDEMAPMYPFLRDVSDCPFVPKSPLDAPLPLAGGFLSCVEWMPTETVHPETWSDAQLESFRAAYDVFSAALQKVTQVGPPEDDAAFFGILEDYVRRFPFVRRLLKSLLDLPPEERTYLPGERLSVTHGDLHSRNYGFCGERFGAFFDFDNVLWGYPADDLAYTVLDRAQRRALTKAEFERCVEVFRSLMAQGGRPVREWRVAVNRKRIRLAASKVQRRPHSPLPAIDIALRDRCIKRFMRAVDLV